MMKSSLPEGGEPLRILLLLESLMRGGIEHQVLYLLQHLDRTRFQPFLVIGKDGPMRPAYEQCGVPMRILARTRGLPWMIKNIWSLRGMICREKIGLIHSWYWDYRGWDLALAKVAGVPYLGSRRDLGVGFWLKTTSWRSRVYRRAVSAIAANTHAAARVLIEQECYPPEHVAVIPNGVPAFPTQVAWPSDIPRFETGITLFYAANFQPRKAHEDLLAAVAMLPDDPPWRLLLAGRARAGHKIVQAIQQTDRILFLGERPDIPAILSGTDIFVMSSTHEGFSNALAEAMSAGLPCVATNAGGNPELIQDGKTGLLVSPRQPADLARAITRLMQDSGLRQELGRNAAQTVRECFPCGKMAQAYEARYTQLAAQ